MKLKCNCCGIIAEVNSISIKYKTINKVVTPVYSHIKTKAPVECELCGASDFEDVSESDGFGTFSKVHSMSRENKREYLKKRSAKHNAKLRKQGGLYNGK